METNIAVFRGKEIRKTIHNNEWWFSVGDVVEALTDTTNSGDYIKKMRKRDEELSKGWGQIVTPLWIATPGNKKLIAPTPRASSASSSPSLPPRPNPSSAGSQRSAMNGYRKSKIPNWRQSARGQFTRLRDIPTTGSRSE